MLAIPASSKYREDLDTRDPFFLHAPPSQMHMMMKPNLYAFTCKISLKSQRFPTRCVSVGLFDEVGYRLREVAACQGLSETGTLALSIFQVENLVMSLTEYVRIKQ